MKWYKITLLIFFLTVLTLFVDVKAGCHYKCAGDRVTYKSGCGFCFEAIIDLSGTSRCIINKNNECVDFKVGCNCFYNVYCGMSSCPDGIPLEKVPNTCKCKEWACPDYDGWEGEPCVVTRDYWDWGCHSRDYSGVWDADERQCIACAPFGKNYQWL